ncbi:MAG: DUF2384 domain-containing protein [Sedimenticola sp.]
MSEMTPEQHLILTKATMSILDSWKLGVEDMRILMGLPEKTGARIFYKYRSHQPFPDEPEINRRMDYVMKIAGALHTTYPTNPHMGSQWLRKKHRRFGRPPLALMLGGDMNDLILVLAQLDCTFGWDLSGSKAS